MFNRSFALLHFLVLCVVDGNSSCREQMKPPTRSHKCWTSQNIPTSQKMLTIFIVVHTACLLLFFLLWFFGRERFKMFNRRKYSPLGIQKLFLVLLWNLCLWLVTQGRSLFFHSSDNNNTTCLLSTITARISDFPELVLCHWLKNCIKGR